MQEALTEQQQETTEYRVVGPPGCGKTTWLGTQVEQAVGEGQQVLVCSLTKAAAAEIGGRGLPISYDSLGTLHSHCYHALSGPEIAESPEHIEDWNEKNPEFRLSLGKNDLGERIDGDNLGETTVGDTEGDRLMSAYLIYRARMATDRMSGKVEALAQRWTEWKEENGLMDFTDLIETCLEEIPTAPGNPGVMFVDEAQDLDLLEMSLIRKWGQRAGRLFVVGDPDQCIYQWRGADPSAFTAARIPEENRWVLEQSYRVPEAIHAHAVRWIEKIEGRERVEYHPRDHEGTVRNVGASWSDPMELLRDAEQYLQRDMSVMFLTSCSYMLKPLIRELREAGIPFHNPYRRRNGAWNPLQRRRGQTTTADRVLAFLQMSLRGTWSAEDIVRWTEMARVKGTLNANGRKLVRNLTDTHDGTLDGGYVNWDDLYQVLTDGAIEAGLGGDLDWLDEQMTSTKRNAARYPIAIARNRGPEHLNRTPRITVGTIHSVKGAESDVVYAFPDISRAGAQEWNGTPAQVATVIRLFYVAMTRARDTLVLTDPAADRNNHSVNLRR